MSTDDSEVTTQIMAAGRAGISAFRALAALLHDPRDTRRAAMLIGHLLHAHGRLGTLTPPVSVAPLHQEMRDALDRDGDVLLWMLETGTRARTVKAVANAATVLRHVSGKLDL